MTAVLLAERANARVYHADWRALLDVVPNCDLLLVDAPYSEETHAGHAKGAQTANRARAWASTAPESPEQRYAARGRGERRTINYAPWTPADVGAFVAAWAPRTRGWFVTITDSELARVWRTALKAAGRYTFAPLPYVAVGSRCRMSGDGPPCITNWIVVARPRALPWSKWATSAALAARGAQPLPGAYVLPSGFSVDLPVVGGKPPWLMERLVEDYSSRGAIVCDPACGAGTTLRAAQMTGRIGVGGDVLLEHARLAAATISQPVPLRHRALVEAPTAEQRALFA